MTKEKDGISMPHIVKQINCSSGCDIDLLQKHAVLYETLHGVDQTVLTQFLMDSKNFESNMKPVKLNRYENVISVEPESGQNEYTIHVWFQNQKEEKYLYTFIIKHGASSGHYTVKKCD